MAGERQAGAPRALDGVDTQLSVGRFRFELSYRLVPGDYGVCLSVFGPVDERQEEVLRYDCFSDSPHYHLAWSYQDLPYVPIADDDPIRWAIGSLTEINDLLERAGADRLSAAEQALLADELDWLHGRADRLATAKQPQFVARQRGDFG